MYLPTPSWFRYRRGLAQLDAYVIQLLNERWHARMQGSERKADLLEKRLDVILVRPLDLSNLLWSLYAISFACLSLLQSGKSLMCDDLSSSLLGKSP